MPVVRKCQSKFTSDFFYIEFARNNFCRLLCVGNVLNILIRESGHITLTSLDVVLPASPRLGRAEDASVAKIKR